MHVYFTFPAELKWGVVHQVQKGDDFSFPEIKKNFYSTSGNDSTVRMVVHLFIHWIYINRIISSCTRALESGGCWRGCTHALTRHKFVW